MGKFPHRLKPLTKLMLSKVRFKWIDIEQKLFDNNHPISQNNQFLHHKTDQTNKQRVLKYIASSLI